MEYQARIIGGREEIEGCPPFLVDHFLWTCREKPETLGRLAYLRGEGLLLQMTCRERSPKRELRNHRDMVCKDSAMEAFFCFEGKPRADSLYLNFEVNANGAMYAQYGHGREGREFITEEEYALTGVRAKVEADSWTIRLLVPLALLARVCGVRELRAGDVFFANFYKISEDPAIEHYAAWSRIENETPDFHRPEFFGRAVVTD